MGENMESLANVSTPSSPEQNPAALVEKCELCGQRGPLADVPDMVLPICPACYQRALAYPVPTWVRGFLAAMVLLVLASIAFQARFATAYLDMRRGGAAYQRGELAAAAALMSSAARSVPESTQVAAYAAYFDGLHLLSGNRPLEALARFQKARPHLPQDLSIEFPEAMAELGAAFEVREFDRMVAAAEKGVRMYPAIASTHAQLSSALACKYAVSGEGAIRERALAELEVAKRAPAGGLDVGEYEQRIRHRLHSREIIDQKEFQRRFPNGWAQPADSGEGP
jgi:tetratricopeptide (TPR) repeat protein